MLPAEVNFKTPNMSPVSSPLPIRLLLLGVIPLLLSLLPINLYAATGYKLVEGNRSLASQIREANTVYEIHDVFDLKGAKLSLPKNVELRFTGGMFRNGLIEGEGVYIESHLKCFDKISFSEKTTFRNDTARLSWWANDGDDCTVALESMMSLLIPTLYLDVYRVYISHPIKIKMRSRNVVGMTANPRSDWDLSGVNKCTTILPTRSFKASEVSAFFHISASQSEGSIKNICFSGQYKVKYAIFQNEFFYSGEISNNRFDKFTRCAIALNCTTENVRIENNFITLCQCATWISTTPIDEGNLLYFNYGKAKGATNLVRYISNYITYCCYGLVCQIGTDLQCLRNTIAHTSCYGIYARVYGVANLDGNYFEGCGRSSFWINDQGLTGALDADKTCEYLQKKHRGENNAQVIGWGLSDGPAVIRPVVYLFGEGTTSWDLKAVIRNSWISNNFIRSYSSDKQLSSSNSRGGVDCFACIGSGSYIFENNSCPLWNGKRPLYFIGFSSQGQSNKNTKNNPCKIFIRDIPRSFEGDQWLADNNKNIMTKAIIVKEQFL